MFEIFIVVKGSPGDNNKPWEELMYYCCIYTLGPMPLTYLFVIASQRTSNCLFSSINIKVNKLKFFVCSAVFRCLLYIHIVSSLIWKIYIDVHLSWYIMLSVVIIIVLYNGRIYYFLWQAGRQAKYTCLSFQKMDFQLYSRLT